MALNIADRPVYYYSGGQPFDPARPTVLMIHGAGHDHSVWRYAARHLVRQGFTVVAPDLPAHGRSAGPALASIETLADWLVELMDSLAIATAAVVGHSMGSLIALQAAACYPQRIRKLVLVGSAVPMPVADALLQAAENDPALAHSMINQWSYTPASGNGHIPGMSQTALNCRLMERQPPQTLSADLAACHHYHGGNEAAAAIRCPALMICGERDRMTPPRASQPLFNALTQSSPHTLKNTIPAAGHAIMAEAPEELNSSLRAFLSLSD